MESRQGGVFMQNIDFSRIRPHGGSQNKGFEELVCQLAHLSKPANAKYFVRKDGAGGDAGVECYWKLNDGSEHAWQAKYFMGTLGDTQWGQITRSVKSALDKHPKLAKYYVCLPIDRSDTQINKWETHVRKWKEMSKERSVQVKFCYWGQHEISSMLQRDTDDFAGRAKYWFSEPILTMDIFKELARKSENALGERYTPEQHIDLPIAHKFEALGNTENWWKELAGHVKKWTDVSSQSGKRLVKVLEGLGYPKYRNIQTWIDAISNSLQVGLTEKLFVDEIDNYIEELNVLYSYLIDMSSRLSDIDELLGTEKTPDMSRSFRHNFYRFRTDVKVLVEFLKGSSCKLAQQKKALLTGDAGIGKSHLLCDIARSRLGRDLPTAFLLGQHYFGENPLATIKDALDLSDVSYKELLGALDAAGEAHRTNTLIIIDAINEGRKSDDWINYLTIVLDEVSKFRYISIVLSCRTTYVDYLVPDGIVGKSIIEIKHLGFSGLEHRAVSQYLGKQGIATPSVPILSPEFTNPLFLKTCCKAMQEQGMTEFPRGMNGISRLLNFYLDSVEYSVSKRKRYRRGENVVRKALIAFASDLYPDNQHGLPVARAVELVNSFDTRENYKDSLFDVLINENVLAEDIDYVNIKSEDGFHPRRVIRFTYERFSDQFIASSLIENVGDEKITRDSISLREFSPLIGQEYYKYTGILSALSIIIAEKFRIEIVDLLPSNMSGNSQLLKQVFTDTLQWRAAESFNERTLEILNKIDSYEFDSPSLEVFLKVSTEPGHPWNAELLHKELMKKKMPERDALWSIYIANHDYEEDQDTEESIVRSLINWGYSGALDNVDSERIRLCSIVLIWMTSSSNRVVRDQATKSTIRLLSAHSCLVTPLLDKFDNVDDLYVRERLYAIAYGVVTNIDNEQILKEIANSVWKKIFADRKPTPHILLRDYARGVMEYALHKGVLNKDINPALFRPPYQSEWPLDDPSEQGLGSLIGDEHSPIQSSIMGFPGDFGNYMMSCIHDWSPTSIKRQKPQTAHALQIDFAKTLERELRDKLISLLDSSHAEKQNNLNKHQDNLGFIYLDKEHVDKLDAVKKDIENSLGFEAREYFRWVMGVGRTGCIGEFSRKKAQRWVCKRALNLGWSKDLFGDFEKRYFHGRQNDHTIERVGKKYQWIAFYEFLSHLADNCIYIGKGYSGVDNSQFYGPWQIGKRNLDPTHWIKSTEDDGWCKQQGDCWWQPFNYSSGGASVEELQAWLWDEDIVPPFKKLLQVKDGRSNHWLVLTGDASSRKEPERNKDNIPCQTTYFRINSYIVPKDDVIHLKNPTIRENLFGDIPLSSDSTMYQAFIREYPWHPIYKDIPVYRYIGGGNSDFKHGRNVIDNGIKGIMNTVTYRWESAGYDKSVDQSILINLPSRKIVEGLNLHHDLIKLGHWKNHQGETVFFDPSVKEKGPSSSLCRTIHLSDWLKNNDLQIIWLVDGEKQLYIGYSVGRESQFFGSLRYNGIYKLTPENNISGEMWFHKKKP